MEVLIYLTLHVQVDIVPQNTSEPVMIPIKEVLAE
jgi:hypothetical protein